MRLDKRMLGDLDADIRDHIARETQDNIERGMAPDEARYAALRKFGNVTRAKEETREVWSLVWFEQLVQDIRYGMRMLRKNPGFTAAAILTLALAIGPNTAMFSVLNAVLLRPLPYPHPERLIVLRESSAQNGQLSVSYPDFQDWQKRQTVFARLALYRRSGVTLTGLGVPERLGGAVASADLFQILKLTPVLGRVFSSAEDRPGSAASVILSSGFWHRHFGDDPNVIGKTLTLNGDPHIVVGVLPDIPAIPRSAELWTSLGTQLASKPEINRRSNHMGYSALGQLDPGASLDKARDEFSAIALRLAKEFPDSNTGESVVLTPMLETMVGEYHRGLVLLAGAVGLILLIACANLMNLLLAKGAGQEQELAMRSALGATHTRLIRQLLTENVILALAGGAIGLLCAYWARGAILTLAPVGATRFQDTFIDGTVLAFSLGLSLFTGLLFGSLPAWRLARTNLREVLQEGGRGASDGSAKQRMRQALVTSEVALTLVLLVSAGLLVQSLMRLESVKLGFDPHNLLMGVVDLSGRRYAEDSKVNAFYDQLLTRIRALPGVHGATLNSSPPLEMGWETGFEVEGRPPFPPGKGPSAEISVVDSDYFRVMGIPVLRGRSFGPQDTYDGAPSILIDQSFAQRIFPGEDAIGKRLLMWAKTSHERTVTVVGIVPTVRLYGFSEEPRLLQLYFPQSQVVEPNPTLLVRTSGDPAALASVIRRVVYDLDPNQPLFAVRTLENDLKNSISSPRLMVSLLTIFAALAVLLAICGLYGVVAYGVSQRKREIGIRVALGAQRSQVLWLVLSQGARPALAGVAAGLIGCFAATRLLKGFLFGVNVLDPATFVAIPMLLTLVVLLACYIPARRAMLVDPMVALRHE
jgi:putative ABC transport system permease protein